MSDGGGGYSDLPNVTITTTTGTGGITSIVTDDIGGHRFFECGRLWFQLFII